jgi:methionyl-tRNA formyltransferase
MAEGDPRTRTAEPGGVDAHRRSALRRGPHRDGRLRVALLISDDPHHEYLRRALAERFHLVGTLIEPGAAQQRELWRRRRLRDALARSYQVRRQRLTGRARYRRAYFAPLAAPSGDPGPALTFTSLNSGAAAAALAGLRAELTVVCGTTVLRPETLERSPATVNVHAGLLPYYRGNHGVFFAYARGDFARIGASLHLVTPRLDGGEVIEVLLPELFPHDHDEHLYCRAVHLAIEALCTVIERLEAGHAVWSAPQEETGEMFRHRDRSPGLELRTWLARRSGRLRPPHLPPRRHAVLPPNCG